jgi:hypothetical protein
MEKSVIRAIGCVCALSAACLQPPASEDSPLGVDKDEQAILNGGAVDDFTAAYGGFVTLQIVVDGVLTPYCSGVLISNSTLMTAEHCIDDEKVDRLFAHPQDLTVSLGYGTSNQQDQHGYTVYIQSNPVRDYAIVDVAAPFTMPLPDGTLSTSGYSRGFSGVVSEGTPVMCFGSSGGPLRYAPLTATIRYNDNTNKTDMFYEYDQNVGGQIQEPGDSGGACVLTGPDNAIWANAQLVSTNVSCFESEWCTAEASIYAYFDSWTSVTTSH